MPAMVPISGSYNGLSFGLGTALPVVKLDGFWDLPNIKDTDVKRAQDQGAFVGLDLADVRRVTLDLALLGSWSGTQDFAAFTVLLDQVLAAITVQGGIELPLTINDGVRSRRMNVRPRRRKLLTRYELQRRNGVVSVELCATDPRIFDPGPTSSRIRPGTAAHGFLF